MTVTWAGRITETRALPRDANRMVARKCACKTSTGDTGGWADTIRTMSRPATEKPPSKDTSGNLGFEADLVDCMVALPGQLFYSTQIPDWFQNAA